MKKKIQISGATYSAKFFHKPLVCEGLWKNAKSHNHLAKFGGISGPGVFHMQLG